MKKLAILLSGLLCAGMALAASAADPLINLDFANGAGDVELVEAEIVEDATRGNVLQINGAGQGTNRQSYGLYTTPIFENNSWENGLTVSMWIKTAEGSSTLHGTAPIFSIDIANIGYISVVTSLESAINTDGNDTSLGISPRCWNDPVNIGGGQNLTEEGKWQMMTVTYSPDGMKLYMDGELYSEPVINTGTNDDFLFQVEFAYALRLGSWLCDWWNYGDYEGLIDDVLVYNTALTADEVSALYDSTKLAEAAGAATAADFVTYTEYPETPGTELVYATGDMDMLTGYNGTIGTDLHNLASGGQSYCLKGNTSTWYDFEVSEKTDVTFYVGYIARDGGANRGLDWSLDDPNGEKRVFMDIPESAEQQWVSATFTVDAGKHSFYLYAPTNMDDSTLKSCDVYSVELYGAPAAGAETATTETAPAATATAPAVGELQNLALGAKVEVSGTETAELVGELAVDGDMTTRWASDYVDEAYITLDLGTPIPVGYLEIYWETACPQDYVVETSSNGTEWTNVATVTGNTTGASPAGDAVIHEFTPATARFIRITTSKRNTEYGNSIWEIVARASKDAVVTETSGAYPASATDIPDGSVIINGARIGIETGWGDNAATGRDAAFDGDTATFFDPLGTGDGYCGVDAGEEMILTKILIHPRDGQLPRFNGATIEGANEEDFSDAVALYISVEEASEFAWIDVSDEIETADNTGYRYFRYINYTNHGDVAEVELYGYAVDGTNPGVVEAPVVEETPVVEEPVVEEPVVEEPAEEVVVEEPVVEEPAVEEPVEEVVEEVVEEAAQTFDFGVIAAVAAIVSAAGYAISKKR